MANELTVRNGSEIAAPTPPLPGSSAALSFNEMLELAKCIAASGLYAMKTPEQAMVLMQLCQATGLHPVLAVQQYHIVNGRPVMRADAMLAEFQRRGGVIEYHERTDEKVSATLTNGKTSARITWDTERAKKAKLLEKPGPWHQFPCQMLTARVISEGVRTVMPGVCAGIYTPEEAQQMEPVALPSPIIHPPTAAGGSLGGDSASNPAEPETAAAAEESKGKGNGNGQKAQQAAYVTFAQRGKALGHDIYTDGKPDPAKVAELYNAVMGRPRDEKTPPTKEQWMEATDRLPAYTEGLNAPSGLPTDDLADPFEED